MEEMYASKHMCTNAEKTTFLGQDDKSIVEGGGTALTRPKLTQPCLPPALFSCEDRQGSFGSMPELPWRSCHFLILGHPNLHVLPIHPCKKQAYFSAGWVQNWASNSWEIALFPKVNYRDPKIPNKNDESVKEAPAYCRSFLDCLHNWKAFSY